MSGSTFGNLFQITTWGESHGKGIGVVIDGCPAGLALCEEDIQQYLNRRKPGQSKYTTPRKEDDTVEILSGVFEGKTTGTSISLMVRNTSQRSKDYSEIASYFRPGHADLTYELKYGFRDYRGGGRSSGRETIGRVAAGAVAAKLLSEFGIEVHAYTLSIGPVCCSPEHFCLAETENNRLYMPDAQAAVLASEYLDTCMKNQDSSGGVIECVISHMKPGVGDPVFEKLSANLGKAVLSIGAVKGFEIGDGFAVAAATGSRNNDAYEIHADGMIHKITNHSGGILGGISDGSDIVFRAAVKPTPSIAREQQTVTRNGETIPIKIKGRHDPVIVPRAVVVVESMAAITVLDLLMKSMTSTVSNMKKYFDD